MKKQGIDPDADKVDEKPKKEYDTSFLKKYQLDEEEEETKDSPVEKTVDQPKEETKEAKPLTAKQKFMQQQIAAMEPKDAALGAHKK